LEKVPELCNLLINYGDSVPFEMEETVETNAVVDNSVELDGVAAIIETSNTLQNFSEETIIQVNEVGQVIQVNDYPS